MADTLDGILNEPNINFVGKDGFFWWVGEVEDNEDPMELGRVKVRVLGYYTNFRGGTTGDLPTEHLPWASVLQHTSQAGNDGQGESSGQLQPGAIVMGFFMDGESAQMPIVIGVMRVKKSDDTIDKKKFAFTGEDMEPGLAPNASSLNPMFPNSSQASSKDEGFKRQGPTNTVKMPSMKSATTGGPGSPSNIGTILGGSGGNPLKPRNPEEPIPSANGVGGPVKNVKRDLKRRIEDISQTASTLVKNESGTYTNITTGKSVTKEELTANLENAIGGIMTQVTAAIRKSMANLAEDLQESNVQEQADGTPFVILQAVQQAASEILGSLCGVDSQLQSLVSNPIQTVTGILDDYLDGLIDQTEFVDKAVDESINDIVCGVESMISKAQGIISSVTSTIDSAGGGEAKEVLDQWKKADNIFSEATDLFKNAESAVDLLAGLLKMFMKFIKSNCDRKPDGGTDDSGWFPLFGTTNCSEEELAEINKIRGSDRGTCGGDSKGGSLIDSILHEVDPFLASAKTEINGAYDMHVGTPGRQATISRKPSGTTHTSVNINNSEFAKHVCRKTMREQNPDMSEEEIAKKCESYRKEQTGGKGDTGSLVADHTTYAGNFTKEVHGDECKLVDANCDTTVDGDYRLKVTGDFHLEVGGAMFITATASPKLKDKKGKKKNEKIQKHTISFNSDVDFAVNGAALRFEASEYNIGAPKMFITGNDFESKYQTQKYNSGDEIHTALNSYTLNTLTQQTNINIEKKEAATTGIYREVYGSIVDTLHPDGSTAAAIPQYTINNESGPFALTCGNTGATVDVVEGSLFVDVETAIQTDSGSNTTIKAESAIGINAEDAVTLTGSSIFLN